MSHSTLPRYKWKKWPILLHQRVGVQKQVSLIFYSLIIFISGHKTIVCAFFLRMYFAGNKCDAKTLLVRYLGCGGPPFIVDFFVLRSWSAKVQLVSEHHLNGRGVPCSSTCTCFCFQEQGLKGSPPSVSYVIIWGFFRY